MPFKVQVGPHQIAIHHGQTVLVSEPNGQINWPSERGRISSTRASSAVGPSSEWRTVEPSERRRDHPPRITNLSYQSEFRTPDGAIAERTLGLVISRLINDGMHEDLDITNNGMKRVRFQLEIAVRCDFADIFEVKSNDIVRRGQITTEWSQTKQRASDRLPKRRFHPRRHDRARRSRAERHLCQRPAQLRNRPRSRVRPGTAACSTRSKTVTDLFSAVR